MTVISKLLQALFAHCGRQLDVQTTISAPFQPTPSTDLHTAARPPASPTARAAGIEPSIRRWKLALSRLSDPLFERPDAPSDAPTGKTRPIAPRPIPGAVLGRAGQVTGDPPKSSAILASRFCSGACPTTSSPGTTSRCVGVTRRPPPSWVRRSRRQGAVAGAHNKAGGTCSVANGVLTLQRPVRFTCTSGSDRYVLAASGICEARRSLDPRIARAAPPDSVAPGA